MFIKFGDKTKPVIVKPGKRPLDKAADESVIYIDDKDEKNRRLSALNKEDDEKEEE
tara:strand:- start:555 stop:722 length:168 start_codon:yes stop_codon:yes gene_type:complete